MSGPLHNPALVSPGLVGPAQPVAPTPGQRSSDPAPAGGPSFAEVLSQSTDEASTPKFSRHALQRLAQRGIDVGGPTLGRLADGVARAAGKGSRESVVFVDGTAFVVSVANNTVITAVGADQMRQQVFTNIDSAVIA